MSRLKPMAELQLKSWLCWSPSDGKYHFHAFWEGHGILFLPSFYGWNNFKTVWMGPTWKPAPLPSKHFPLSIPHPQTNCLRTHLPAQPLPSALPLHPAPQTLDLALQNTFSILDWPGEPENKPWSLVSGLHRKAQYLHEHFYLKSVSVSLFQEIMISIQLPCSRRCSLEQWSQLLTDSFDQHPSESVISGGDQIPWSPLPTTTVCEHLPFNIPSSHFPIPPYKPFPGNISRRGKKGLTHDWILGLEECPSLAKPHCPTHLPRIMFWHVYDLWKEFRGRWESGRNNNNRQTLTH